MLCGAQLRSKVVSGFWTPPYLKVKENLEIMSKAFSPWLEILKQNTNIQSLQLYWSKKCSVFLKLGLLAVGSQIIVLMANVPFVYKYSGEQHSKLNCIVIVHSTGLCELRNSQRIQR